MQPLHYTLLGVPRDADDVAIRSAYRRRALVTHPDKGGQASVFLQVVEAFEILSDRVRRAEYDEELRRTNSKDGDETAAPFAREAHASEAAADVKPADEAASVIGLAGHPAPEGAGQLAEENRGATMWHEFLACSVDERVARVGGLSCRAAETLLAYAQSEACQGGAPVAAPDMPVRGQGLSDDASVAADDVSVTAPNGTFGCGGCGSVSANEGLVYGGDAPTGGRGDPRIGVADNESCGAALLVLCEETSGDTREGVIGVATAHADSECVVAPRTAKRPRLDPLEASLATVQAMSPVAATSLKDAAATARSGQGRRGPPQRGRAWICLDNFKVCTRSSGDLTECINWHIMLVRIKQLYHERTKAGADFDTALKAAITIALADRAVEGGSDPKLRYVTEYTTTSGVLFTPATQDLFIGLRQRAELEKLRATCAGRDEVVAAIRRMTIASQAAADDQQRLVKLIENHLKAFRRVFRWQGRRPEGVNAVFGGATAGKERGLGRIYAELWRPTADGNVLVCRGPGRQRSDEALRDLNAMRLAQAEERGDGDAAACREARRLYEQVMRGTPLAPPATAEARAVPGTASAQSASGVSAPFPPAPSNLTKQGNSFASAVSTESCSASSPVSVVSWPMARAMVTTPVLCTRESNGVALARELAIDQSGGDKVSEGGGDKVSLRCGDENHGEPALRVRRDAPTANGAAAG
eukprot:TRINITY_DN67035_c0_g1_i1.p1 TRINITY_DN67035_c0_g1~~TRINITY_DN67035_c0_g1_i1.p1  ORF type:complete len:702 (+),score=110.31 TRINITY_DN67035_c0_g1_i1:114-2219(+)